MKRLRFSKSRRLLRNHQFRSVLAQRHRAADGLLVLHVAPNDVGLPRLGVSVGKACGPAVVRNRLKRLLREAFRINQERIPAGYDYVVTITRKGPEKGQSGCPAPPATCKLDRIQTSFLALVHKVFARDFPEIPGVSDPG